MTARYIIERVRAIIDQAPLLGEHTLTDSSVVGSWSTEFSNHDLLDRINAAQKDIVSKVKAQYIPASIGVVDTDLGSTLPNFNNINVVRLLLSKVNAFYGGSAIPARRRRVDAHRVMDQERPATTTYPIYTWEDRELHVYPLGYTRVVAWIIEEPTNITYQDLEDETDDLILTELFEYAICLHVAASCYQSMEDREAYEFTMGAYEDEIQPFILNMRLNYTFDDRESLIE